LSVSQAIAETNTESRLAGKRASAAYLYSNCGCNRRYRNKAKSWLGGGENRFRIGAIAEIEICGTEGSHTGNILWSTRRNIQHAAGQDALR